MLWCFVLSWFQGWRPALDLFSLSGRISYRQVSKSRSREKGCYNHRIAQKFDRHLDSVAAEGPAKFYSEWTSQNINFLDFTRTCGKTPVRLVNRALVGARCRNVRGHALSLCDRVHCDRKPSISVLISIITWRFISPHECQYLALKLRIWCLNREPIKITCRFTVPIVKGGGAPDSLSSIVNIRVFNVQTQFW